MLDDKEEFVLKAVGACEHKDCVLQMEEQKYRMHNRDNHFEDGNVEKEIKASDCNVEEIRTFKQEVKKKQNEQTKSFLNILNEKHPKAKENKTVVGFKVGDIRQRNKK